MENFTIQKLVYYSLLNLQSVDTLQKGNIAMSMYFAAKYTQNKEWEKKGISILRQNLLKDTKSDVTSILYILGILNKENAVENEVIDCILPCLKKIYASITITIIKDDTITLCSLLRKYILLRLFHFHLNRIDEFNLQEIGNALVRIVRKQPNVIIPIPITDLYLLYLKTYYIYSRLDICKPVISLLLFQYSIGKATFSYPQYLLLHNLYAPFESHKNLSNLFPDKFRIEHILNIKILLESALTELFFVGETQMTKFVNNGTLLSERTIERLISDSQQKFSINGIPGLIVLLSLLQNKIEPVNKNQETLLFLSMAK